MATKSHRLFMLVLILPTAMEKNQEKAWDQNYVTDWKWWTQSVRNVDSVCTNRVHHFWSVTYF